MQRIDLVRGTMAALLAHPALAARGADDVRVVLPAWPPIPWIAARRLVQAITAERGEATVRAALAADPAAASLIFPALVEALDAAGGSRREQLSAQAPGFLSHNSQVMRPLREAIAALLRPLLGGRRVIVVGGQSLDLHSLALLRQLLGDDGITLTIGFDPGALPEGALERREALQVVAMIEGFAATDGASLVVIDGAAAPATAAPDLAPTDGIEARAFASLAAPEVDVPLVVAAIEASWRCFGFTACLQLATGSLARGAALDGPTHRRVQLLLALAAYNRQVSSRGESREADEALAELLDVHFRAALDGEDEPLARSHLLYRLALNGARRRGLLADALALADAAVAEAARAGSPFVEAWARNGRAYVLGRMGDLDGAIAEVEAAFAMTAAPLVGGLASEQEITRVVLAENLSALNNWAGRPDAALRWQATCVALARARGGELLVSLGWLALLVERGELAEAQTLAEAGLRAAEALLSPNDADTYAAWVGELAYRRGDAARARTAHERAALLSRRMGADARVGPTELAVGLATLRAGDPAAAEAVFADMSERTEDEGPRAELLGLRGLAAAGRGDAAGATAAINAAIAAAVALGERDVLLRVATCAGEACLALGDLPAARGAFAQARSMASGEPPAQPHDVLAALAGGFAAGEVDRAAVREALAILEPALADAESWWQLGRLAAAYLALAEPGEVAEPPELGEPSEVGEPSEPSEPDEPAESADLGEPAELELLRARLGQRIDADPTVLARLVPAAV